MALVLIMAPAAWLLLGVLARAWRHWQWSVLWTQLTPTGGGLRDQILGTLILMVGVLHHRRHHRRAGRHPPGRVHPRAARSAGGSSGPLRTASDILSGFPSIVLGYVGYVALVVGLHWGFSLLPALIILSIMVIPYIAKTTENSLRQVPTGYREGAEALGMSAGYGLRKVVLKSAAARHRHRAAAGPGHRLRRDGPAHLHGRVLQHPAALADPRPVPVPDLRRLHLLQRPVGAEALPLLRRRPDPGRDRAPPAGGQPDRRVPHPAPLRERPRPAGTGLRPLPPGPQPARDRPNAGDPPGRRRACRRAPAWARPDRPATATDLLRWPAAAPPTDEEETVERRT